MVHAGKHGMACVFGVRVARVNVLPQEVAAHSLAQLSPSQYSEDAAQKKREERKTEYIALIST